jgi:predicted dehydrogenase
MNERIGIIGAGTIADLYYIPSLKYMGYTNLALYDTNATSASVLAKKHQIPAIPLADLIQTADTLIIATPPHSHFNLLQQCIKAGHKTIICEKPFLFSKAEIVSVIALSQQFSCRILVGHIRRVFTAIESARHILPTLALGALQKVYIWEGGRFTYKPKSDYTTHNVYGGVLLDTGSHAIDSLLYVSGLTQTPVVCTVNSVQKDKTEPAHEVNYSFTLNTVSVELHLSRFQALANKITLYYEKGIVEIPLGLKPNFAVSTNGKRNMYSSEAACMNYMSEAFKSELGIMLTQYEDKRFDVSDFVNLTSILETLYTA